eukprot:1759586-Prymnesium_polylepis.1
MCPPLCPTGARRPRHVGPRQGLPAARPLVGAPRPQRGRRRAAGLRGGRAAAAAAEPRGDCLGLREGHRATLAGMRRAARGARRGARALMA